MGRLGRSISLLSVFIILILGLGCNPFDPPLYRTPLPNGYAQDSNGGEFGLIVMPTGDSGGKIIAPIGPGPNGRERFCNDFGWDNDLVVCELIEYADRAFVDPPLSRQYLLFDTRTGQVSYYSTHQELEISWARFSSSPIPALHKEHPNRQVTAE